MVDAERWVVGLACNEQTKQHNITSGPLSRLESFAELRHEVFDEPSSWEAPPPPNPEADERLRRFVGDLDALIVCHGSPRVTPEVLDAAPKLKLVGEMEGDRFAQRIDVEAAMTRGVRAVDTTNGSSYPVAEWALAGMLIGLRNAGALFRRLINHERVYESFEEREQDHGFVQGELSGKKVGLIGGGGHIGRRLTRLLEPFHVDVLVHDPYMPKEVADVLGVTNTTLDNVLSLPDVVVSLVPDTPRTRGMLGARELDLLTPGTVFVNVSRGVVVDSDALIERLRRGDIVASIDVFDPEPIPVDSPIRDLDNVFLTPHIAGVTGRNRSRFFELMVDELERTHAGHDTLYDLLPRTLANRRGADPTTADI